MTGFQSKRQASKSLLEQALDALELARDAHCLPGPVNTLVYQAINSISAELAQPNKWRDAIDAELVCLHLGTVESFPTAKAALEALIDWHVATALDPEVSSDAQALIDRGAAQPQAQPQAEPVAWGMSRADGMVLDVICPDEYEAYAGEYTVPLYAAPQAQPAVAEPLTERQIYELHEQSRLSTVRFARAIEAAHGIKGSAK
jgi:hypothetical protein